MIDYVFDNDLAHTGDDGYVHHYESDDDHEHEDDREDDDEHFKKRWIQKRSFTMYTYAFCIIVPFFLI